ncbi:TIGR04552 family protein [Haliangium ochraceum]|uniref:TIGR04552 family protein n=1 Tax=Haliangium ochraceum (strain DSM 14365 / JCM 11303 / SMP-2) TaxID=502025 RepID=D0LZ40_HALO1|nr:TIGR04552 family protein [Haliangium ochraceum]ACY14510.1 conserved hypothetical protein [Haliangium ochraceum DSM 14365]
MIERSTVRPVIARPATLDELSLFDLESVRLILHGGSVIDWQRLEFHDHEAVARFLRVNEFDPDSPAEMERLDDLRSDAVDYLIRVFQFDIPYHIAEEASVSDLLLIASGDGKNQRWACVVLKVMHIIHHLAGREAIVRLPIADDQVFHATELKVIQIVEEMRATGYPITEFEWSRKPKDSLITKLLAKRSTQAAKVYDKLRFRLTVRHYEDLMPTLAMLTRQLIPFNYVIPGESVNNLIAFDETVTSHARLSTLRAQLQQSEAHAAAGGAPYNEFSGPNYRIINFVTDLPLRLEAILPKDVHVPPQFGHVVFVLAEFQLADKQTAVRNEQGESSHDRYKARQYEQVRARLTRGGFPER